MHIGHRQKKVRTLTNFDVGAPPCVAALHRGRRPWQNRDLKEIEIFGHKKGLNLIEEYADQTIG